MCLIDLLWKFVNIIFVNGDMYGVWFFICYSGLESVFDVLCLCWEIVWQDGFGEIIVWVLGQKVWMISYGDISLLDMVYCIFYVQENDGV